MVGDIICLKDKQFGQVGSKKYNVAANASNNGTSTSYVPAFRSGEPVITDIGTPVVLPLYRVAAGGNSKPAVATDYLVGIATSKSTETDTAAGTVEVEPIEANAVYLIDPKTAATWDTQTEYDALVGKQMLIELSGASYSGGKYCLLADTGATYGCVVQPLDVLKHPGKVAISFRAGLSIMS